MARQSLRDVGITPSVLDRLIDLEPRLSTESVSSRFGGVDELKRAVRRDLEWLLNTRRMVGIYAEAGEEINRSIVTYGVPDITGVNIESKAESSGLRSAVEEAIRIFEPRFIDVSVSMEPMTSLDRQLRLKIEAKLDVDPVPEPMVFDTVLQLGSGTIAVTEAAPNS